MLRRPPPAALAPYVRWLWYLDDAGAIGLPGAARATRERALPTGAMDLVIRLSDTPIRLYAEVEAPVATSYGHAVLGGARSCYYVRDTTVPVRSVGVHFRPGGAAAVLGVPADLLAERHTALTDLWGPRVDAVRTRILEATDAGDALDRLAAALPRPTELHPAVAHALARFAAADVRTVDAVRRETGLSSRRFIELFRRYVGLTPKVYCRVRRFQAVVARAGRGLSWAEVALTAGYFDQAHLNRDFRAFAGVSPGAYRPLAPDRPNHVPIPSIPSKPPRGAPG
ncbi:MAG: helix-turn-helix domain-containing protein [Pseudomonadota bacterium]|nr:helix-turn-helix domain-containing protein [Pseudomonadota bacterium]